MPLKCLKGDRPIYAFNLSVDDWKDLKRSYRDLQMTMPCCGSPAIPKVNHYGTRFFAHKAQSGADCAGRESAHHLMAKYVIAKSAAAVLGWTAETEVFGQTPDGERWQADVLCERDNAKVAFEVQLSQQTLDEYRHRQARYKQSKVRACWLVHQKHCDRLWDRSRAEQALPLFSLDVKDLDNIFVRLNQWVRGSAPIALARFICGVLQGQLTFYQPRPGLQKAYLQLILARCWKCQNEIKIVRGYQAEHADDYELVWLDDTRRPTQIKTIVDELRSTDALITPVGFRYSKTIQSKYFAASCPKCKVLQGKHFMLMKNFSEHEIMHQSIELSLSMVELPEGRWIWKSASQQ